MIERIYMNEELKLKAINYTRKSSEPDDKQVLSLPSQVSELQDLVARRGLKIVDTYQEAKSAKKPANRPLFNEMLERISRGEANCIVVWHPDRLSRNPVDAGRIVYLMDLGKLLQIVTPSQVFTNTPMDKFMVQLQMLQAKLENDNKGVNVKRGLKAKLEKGDYPFVARQGYLNTPWLEKGEKKIIVDKKRFKMVREMWNLLLTGCYTVPEILHIVNEDWGYKTFTRKKIGGTPLSRSALYDLFTNPFYYGWYKVKGIWYKGNHEPMLSKEEFDKAQAILRRFDAPRPKTFEHSFAGLVRCDCGCAVTETQKEKYYPTTKNTRIYHYLHCTRRKKECECKQPPIPLQDFEEQIYRILGEIEIPPDFKDWAIKYLKERAEQERGNIMSLLKSQHGNYYDTEERLQKLLQMRLGGELTSDEYVEEKAKLVTSRDDIKGKIKNVEATADRFMSDMEETFNFACTARERFENGQPFEKKEILSKMGENFILKDEKLHLDLKKSLLQFKKSKSLVVSTIPALEPADLQGISTEVASLATANPIWLRRQDSNLQPSP